jgi:hypothetical protein
MARRINNAKRIRTYMLKHPNHTAQQIAEAVGVSRDYVYQVQHYVRKAKMTKFMPPKVPPVPVIEMIEPQTDSVNHPPHYKAGGIETIDFIEAKQLNYNLGNVVKYITRADLKGNRKQDLEKAAWYLKRELSAL